MEIIMTTFGKKKDANKVCKKLVEEKLVGCATMIKTTSLFRWKGRLSKQAEVLVILKTRKPLSARACRRLKKLHPYEIPEIVVLGAKASKEYLKWLSGETKPIFSQHNSYLYARYSGGQG